jgi:hypothetical protein
MDMQQYEKSYLIRHMETVKVKTFCKINRRRYIVRTNLINSLKSGRSRLGYI